MRSLKSVLGGSLMDETTRIKIPHLHFKEIIGLIVARLKASAECAAGAGVARAVLGRPVHFVDDNPAADRAARDALEEIARAQGFTEIEFQYEPIAAALAYEQTVEREQYALIADIGGGTSDFSIVRVSPEGRARADRGSGRSGQQGRAYRRHGHRPTAQPERGDALLGLNSERAAISGPRSLPVANGFLRRPRDMAQDQSALYAEGLAGIAKHAASFAVAGTDRAADRRDREPARPLGRALGRDRENRAVDAAERRD